MSNPTSFFHIVFQGLGKKHDESPTFSIRSLNWPSNMTLPGGMRNPVPTLASPNGTASGDSWCPEFTEDLDVSGNQWVTDPPNGGGVLGFPATHWTIICFRMGIRKYWNNTYLYYHITITITIIFTCRDGTFKWAWGNSRGSSLVYVAMLWTR